MKKFFPIVILMFCCLQSKGQQQDIVGLIFKDTGNLNITKALDHHLPETVYLLSRTRSWSRGQFQRVDPEGEVHVSAPDPYLFTDTLLASLIPENEKGYLIRQVKKDSSAEIKNVPSDIHLIHSPADIKNGFFFDITRPLLTADKQFAFIERTVYYKFEGQKSRGDMIFGTTTFVFQKKHNRWTLLKKISNLIL